MCRAILQDRRHRIIVSVDLNRINGDPICLDVVAQQSFVEHRRKWSGGTRFGFFAFRIEAVTQNYHVFLILVTLAFAAVP
jgi:hypothetical protein